MKTVLIAGGTGHLGRNIEKELIQKGYRVLILTRSPKKENHIFWNPSENKIDTSNLGFITSQYSDLTIKAIHVHKTHKVASAIIAIVRFE